MTQRDGPPTDPFDGWTETVHRRFSRPASAVFALLSDVERTAGLGPEHTRASWLTANRRLGGQFEGVNRAGEREWEVSCVVVAHVEPELFAWTVGEPSSPSSTWTYQFTRDDHATDVTHTFQHGLGWSGARRALEIHPEQAARIISVRGQQIRHNMEIVLNAAATLLGSP